VHIWVLQRKKLLCCNRSYYVYCMYIVIDVPKLWVLCLHEAHVCMSTRVTDKCIHKGKICPLCMTCHLALMISNFRLVKAINLKWSTNIAWSLEKFQLYMSVDNKVMIFQVDKIGRVWKTPSWKPGHLYYNCNIHVEWLTWNLLLDTSVHYFRQPTLTLLYCSSAWPKKLSNAKAIMNHGHIRNQPGIL